MSKHNWIPVGIVLRVTPHACDCGITHDSSQLFLRQQSTGLATSATIRDSAITDDCAIENRPNLYWKKIVEPTVHTRYCLGCFRERSTNVPPTHCTSNGTRFKQTALGWFEDKPAAAPKPLPFHERVSVKDI